MTVETKGCIHTSICVPPRMRSNAVGGRLLNSSLAWDGAVMMPLQCTPHTGQRGRCGGVLAHDSIPPSIKRIG
jgi:hypothetical protein